MDLAETLRLYRYRNVLGVCQNFSASGRLGGAGPLNVNLGPPDISETTTVKVEFKNTIRHPHWVQTLLYYMTQHEDGRHIDFRLMSVFEAGYG